VIRFDSIEMLEAALRDLGAVLAREQQTFELFVIGGAAFLLREPERAQATGDLDVAAQVLGDRSLGVPVPLPIELQAAAAIVARLHGLSPGWLNSAAAASFDHLVPDGALERADARTWGGLTLHVASRRDLIRLKFRAALRRGAPGERYRRDLALAHPDDAELEDAVRWYRSIDRVDGDATRIDAVVEHVREMRDEG
jgi:hypothetical protein